MPKISDEFAHRVLANSAPDEHLLFDSQQGRTTAYWQADGCLVSHWTPSLEADSWSARLRSRTMPMPGFGYVDLFDYLLRWPPTTTAWEWHCRIGRVAVDAHVVRRCVEEHRPLFLEAAEIPAAALVLIDALCPGEDITVTPTKTDYCLEGFAARVITAGRW